MKSVFKSRYSHIDFDQYYFLACDSVEDIRALERLRAALNTDGEFCLKSEVTLLANSAIFCTIFHILRRELFLRSKKKMNGDSPPEYSCNDEYMGRASSGLENKAPQCQYRLSVNENMERVCGESKAIKTPNLYEDGPIFELLKLVALIDSNRKVEYGEEVIESYARYCYPLSWIPGLSNFKMLRYPLGQPPTRRSIFSGWKHSNKIKELDQESKEYLQGRIYCLIDQVKPVPGGILLLEEFTRSLIKKSNIAPSVAVEVVMAASDYAERYIFTETLISAGEKRGLKQAIAAESSCRFNLVQTLMQLAVQAQGYIRNLD